MLQIYNSLTLQKENFKPISDKRVNVYVCGVTVYDYCHIGHARTYTFADVLIAYLRFSGHQVNYVRNITDIDDKIIKRANENKEDFHVLTDRFIRAMHEDFATLGLQMPDHEPRATAFISEMIDLIQKIIASHHGYVADNGDVYFSTREFKKYGCLSHHQLDQLESGARVEVAEVKRDPLDFVLWKIAKPGEPSWDSPWGKGRPGWHIECSAMCMGLLGPNFDIHAGGRDLIFPHHENEIAQSECVTGQPLANYWMHAGFLQVDKEKMSKSLGNFITIRDALRDHSPEVLRYFFISSQYRSPLVYTDDAFVQAKRALARLYTAIRFLPEAIPLVGSEYEQQFREVMDDDLNTPRALSILFDLAHETQRLAETDTAKAAASAALLKKLGNVLGILSLSPDVFFQSDPAVDVAKVEKLIAAREVARQNRDWAEADRLRAALLEMHVVIEDSSQGTTWRMM
ncbi:MAG TPA: cysteine--tRNA ligase [Gammaproteobacteria bacterium]|jgi:cysteinyl-tRNA synthetase|nr:cysteine--tRNA ligase [Gammaproteobacteria bacterium]